MNFIEEANLSPEDFIRKNVSDEEREHLAQEFREEIGSISLERQIIDIPWLGKYNQTILLLSLVCQMVLFFYRSANSILLNIF